MKSKVDCNCTSCHPEMFCKNGVLKNFTKFIGKNLCWRGSNFIKKETLTQLFSYKFCKIFKIAFFTEYFRWLLFSYIEHYLAKPESIVGRFSRDDFSWYITLRGKCLYSEHFWSIFFPIWTEFDKIRSISPDTKYLSVFSPNAAKHRPEKLRLQQLFMQCQKNYFRDFYIND